MTKAPEKPSSSEEEFIARQEAEKLRKATLEKHREMEQEEREKLKQLHFMRCPSCGMELHSAMFSGMKIDKCYSCNGTWLDAGELEKLAKKEPGLVGKLVSVFHHGDKK
jgi:hypothetical protein